MDASRCKPEVDRRGLTWAGLNQIEPILRAAFLKLAPPAPKSTGAVERQVACGPLDTLIVHPESQTCKHCEGEADRG